MINSIKTKLNNKIKGSVPIGQSFLYIFDLEINSYGDSSMETTGLPSSGGSTGTSAGGS